MPYDTSLENRRRASWRISSRRPHMIRLKAKMNLLTTKNRIQANRRRRLRRRAPRRLLSGSWYKIPHATKMSLEMTYKMPAKRRRASRRPSSRRRQKFTNVAKMSHGESSDAMMAKRRRASRLLSSRHRQKFRIQQRRARDGIRHYAGIQTPSVARFLITRLISRTQNQHNWN
jgi:hypothetical protein